MLTTGKPSTYPAMRLAAMQIDNRYWERQRERKRAGDRSSQPSSSKSDNTPNQGKGKKPNKPAQSSPATTANAPSKQLNKPASFAPQAASSSSRPTPTSIADKLGRDGHLKPAERQRRLDNNLCMLCGSSSHALPDCPKRQLSATPSTSSANPAPTPRPKGRKAATTESSDAATTSSAPADSKK